MEYIVTKKTRKETRDKEREDSTDCQNSWAAQRKGAAVRLHFHQIWCYNETGQGCAGACHLIHKTEPIVWRSSLCSYCGQIVSRHDWPLQCDADCGDQKVGPNFSFAAILDTCSNKKCPEQPCNIRQWNNKYMITVNCKLAHISNSAIKRLTRLLSP